MDISLFLDCCLTEMDYIAPESIQQATMNDKEKDMQEIQQALDELNAVSAMEKDEKTTLEKKTPCWGEVLLRLTQIAFICASVFFAFAGILGFWGWVLLFLSGIVLICTVGYTVGGWNWKKDQKEYEEKGKKKKEEKTKNKKPYCTYWQLYYYQKTGDPKYLTVEWRRKFVGRLG